ncbi:4Fe-4S dicluster domain-containing protein [Lacrimispora amygdalina]|uniref:4Fe-4S dicluster domain-containing protein n=1 Tax=Lacrimispora amygdalina TaxID=253257 RepID=A0A3E2NEI4_9FIRM|nr:FAD-dependent oxidoreductase [Clostridium indicum]RFZ79422.1 4Fe-4S dicluster domain-containing protein [Clostridium indicum]
MAVITIDGKRMEVPDGRNVLDCALDAGIYIPHLCHHPDLKPLGSCRMCLVEVDGGETPVTSCNLIAKTGMNIRTDSEEIARLRMLSLELILTGHPEDCSTCPKYGSCELQTLIQYIGPKTGRLKMRIKGFRTEEENPLLVHDMNRCVLCGRCVRACQELRGVHVLDYRQKGLETYVGTVHEKLLADADCRFCGACAEVCPTGAIRDKWKEGQERRSKQDRIVPCRYGCPAHIDIPRYVRLAGEARYDEAAAVVREKAPFPEILGHICSHACELECKRGEINKSVSIRNIKRYAAEHDTGSCWRGKGKQLKDSGKKVCIVGAGPAGLTAAYYLRKQGHEVTVKESLPQVGGMMSYGIPSYRLPREVITKETALITEAGVRIETSVKVENPSLLLKEYDAVLMAVGSHKGIRLTMEGDHLPGVVLNTDFLRQVNLGEPVDLGSRVVVLGGGNVAFDCARTAKRLGAERVLLACLEAREAMTADEEEILQAEEEGIGIYPAHTFERITGTKKVTGVDFMKVKSFTFDVQRKAVIEKQEGTELHLEADTVIFAVGQRPDLDETSGLLLGRGNCIQVKEHSLKTSCDGVFAAGDAVYGTKSVIAAIASGREAASEIDRYLGGDGDISEKLAPDESVSPHIGSCPGFAYRERQESQLLPAEQRVANFNIADTGIGECVSLETGRCLQCDLRLNIAQPRLWGDYSGQEGTDV